MKKLLGLISGLILISGCADINSENTQKVTTTCHKLDTFKAIIVSGNARVRLVKGRTNQMVITGKNFGKYADQNKVVNQVLYITGGDDTLASEITATIRDSADLRSITVTNNAIINARDFTVKNLIITAKDNGTVNLEGWFNIDKIFQYGHGRINISWVSSDSLSITGQGSGPIYLGGRVDNLVAKLSKDAKLHAHYLRTMKAQVFTTDQAFAEVLVLDNLSAFAVDSSNIYYHKRPKNITVVTKGHGNVLYAGWIR